MRRRQSFNTDKLIALLKELYPQSIDDDGTLDVACINLLVDIRFLVDDVNKKNADNPDIFNLDFGLMNRTAEKTYREETPPKIVDVLRVSASEFAVVTDGVVNTPRWKERGPATAYANAVRAGERAPELSSTESTRRIQPVGYRP
jgi:hypothetical protein